MMPHSHGTPQRRPISILREPRVIYRKVDWSIEGCPICTSKVLKGCPISAMRAHEIIVRDINRSERRCSISILRVYKIVMILATELSRDKQDDAHILQRVPVLKTSHGIH